MARQFITAFFLVAFFMQTFSKAVVVVWFYANQKVIARTLCENRGKPQMNCCGKCQLKKEMAREDREADKEPLLKYESKGQPLFCSGFLLSVPAPFTGTSTASTTLSTPKTVERAGDIFKPPC